MIRRFVLSGLILLGVMAGRAGVEPDAAIEPGPGMGQRKARLTGASSAVDVLQACREMMPTRPIELKGALVLRNRKGIVSDEYAYRLVMRREADMALMTVQLMPRGATNLLASVTISRRSGTRPSVRYVNAEGADEKVDSLLSAVMGTDVTWLDLTFDFLWWRDASFEAEREGETVHGQKCAVILVRPPERIDGLEAVRLWADSKTGCLMQTEQLGPALSPLRRLWGTRVKKFDNRWMVSALEVETLGQKHRTKITVDSLKEL